MIHSQAVQDTGLRMVAASRRLRRPGHQERRRLRDARRPDTSEEQVHKVDQCQAGYRDEAKSKPPGDHDAAELRSDG
jgi:hypothetical protein